MDILSVLRTIGALSLVLGLLGGALWIVRRYDIHFPTQLLAGRSADRRLVLVERLALDGRRAVMLIRCDDREHAVLVAPEGVVTLAQTRRADDLSTEANDA